MKRNGSLFSVLVVLAVWVAGCSTGPTPDQIAVKQAFIRELIGFCAAVDQRLANIDAKEQPGTYADQFALFADQAQRQPAPELDRDQFQIMLNGIDNTVAQFRSAQTALHAGDRPKADAALVQANQQLAGADAAAQEYGMPPLSTCPEHQPGATPAASSPTATPSPAAAGWHPRHEAAVAVQQINATVLGGRIWVAGGLVSSDEPTASTQFYDPIINSWGLGPELPEPVHHAMLVTYRDQLVLIGGFHAHDKDMLAVTSPQMLVLDNNTGKWERGPDLNYPRAAGGAAVIGDQIVVVGGRTGDPQELVAPTEIYDGTSWRVAAALPVPGDHLAVTANSNYVYAVGGRKFTAGSNTDAVQRYDPRTNQWTILTPTPQPLSGSGAAIVDGRLIIVGSEGTTTVSGALYDDDLTDTPAIWDTGLPALPTPRHGLAVTAIGNTLYAIGGATKPGHTASTNIVEALSFS